ncbi:MAG: M23 family metallopeptidase [Thermoanaerobaculia bacterium]
MPYQSDSFDLRRLRRRRRLRLIVFLFVTAAVYFVAAGAFRTGPPPKVELTSARSAIGKNSAVGIRVTEPKRGISRILLELTQGAQTLTLLDEASATPPGWALWGRNVTEREVRVPVGQSTQPTLVEGLASLRLTAWSAPSWLRRGKATETTLDLPVRLTPPVVQILSSEHRPTQGGCEVVVYRVGETSRHDGVEVGERFFPGAQLPGGLAGDRFALFAVPYDVADPSTVRLVAEDDVENRRELAFLDQFTPLAPRADDIVIDDRFLAKVVPEILAATPGAAEQGSPIESYLWINRELRRRNNEELAALAGKSEQAFLWKVAFLPFPGGQVMSSFADRRTYFYQGKEIDRQDHLGFDLASVARADVPAANDGVVVLAKNLGIYGNAVVVDHGFGLMSLYAHLSSIAVEPGTRVRRGQLLGNSGTTGLAAGDHLHFSFLLHGLPVRPVEWWDAHWIADRLKRKLGNALPFGG